ncbi:hypothetical protein [Mesorhizobium sp. M0040]|uniref:hypothetical protein n=1 Tax=Mesorhizobium sp. M0040 TaxID=2956855 RepID=UPI00333D54E4
MAAGKIPEKTRQDDTCKSWIDADGEAAGLELGNVVRQAANPRHTLDDLANLLVEQHRFCGWDQATRTPYEQLNLQRVFKVGDVRADRWLGDMQKLTCAGHGSRLHHSPERLKLLVVLRRNLPPKAQWEAATALGFRFTRTLRLVIVPQAVRLMLPPTVGFMVQIVKTRSIASLIGLTELAGAATQVNTVTFSRSWRSARCRSSTSRCAGRYRSMQAIWIRKVETPLVMPAV